MPGQTNSTTATIQVQPTGTLVRVQKPTPGLKVKTNIKAGVSPIFIPDDCNYPIPATTHH